MTELKCPECYKEIKEEVLDCPHCGFPIKNEKKEKTIETMTTQFKKTNIMPLISLLLGILIIIMGIVVANKKATIDTYSAKNYNIEGAKFGADFYTEIYTATDVIVDELNDINKGVETLSQTIVSISNVIYYSAGMIITATGIAVVAISCNNIKRVTM